MTEQVNIGISERDRVFIAEALKNLLADSYLLYIQTHNFHWNVTGPNFNALHIMFEGQYKELADAVDDIAERIRALDVIAPATYKAFSALSAIEEVDGTISAEQMISTLVKSHETVINTCRKILKLAQQAEDESTISLASDRMRIHEKTAWMLRATNQ